MQDFDIRPIPEEEIYRAQCYIDQIAKPLGAMGKLETLAARLAALQDTLQPSLRHVSTSSLPLTTASRPRA